VTTRTTERLTLRPWRRDEADVLLEIRGNPEIAKWLGSPEPWTHVGQAKREIGMWQARIDADDSFGTWAIVPNPDAGGGADTPVGSVNLGPIRFGPEIEIGWYLHPDATGRGWAGEAAQATLEWGLDAGVQRIWALMWRHNEQSARVARAIGMRELGVLIDPWYGSEEDPYSRMFVARSDTNPT
jgi:RimJ/RimL family protein N-acetyltransferase